MPITQNISQFPLAPQAGTDTPEEFSSKADAFVAHQADAYVGEVNTWAGQANTVQTDVNQNATNAGLSETNANQSAIDASGSALSAGNSETNASTSETNAGLSASQASQSATDAGISETNAGTSETNAGLSETNALQSAQDAETASDSAQASANYTGEWNSGTSYLVGQSVSLSNVFYFCKIPNSNLNPPDNPTEWQESGSVTVYAGLGDVSLAGLEDNKYMVYDNLAEVWKPANWDGQVLSGQDLIDVGIVGTSPEATLYPDGSIVGSSSNGSFTKYSNGNIEMYHSRNASFSGNTYAIANWIFPIPFLNTDYIPIGAPDNLISPEAKACFVYAVKYLATASETNIVVERADGTNSTGNVDISMTVKGRWR